MKKISNSTIITHRGLQYGLMDLLPNYKKITDVEKKIAEARLSEISVGQLDESDFITDLLDCLVSVSAISGHVLPEQPHLAKRLNEELRTQLLEYGYSELTIPEIVLAFRLNCHSNLKYPSGSDSVTVDIIGRFVNVDYVTRVLNIYCTFRTMLDNQLKNTVDGYQ